MSCLSTLRMVKMTNGGVREKSTNVEGKHAVIEISKDAELPDSTVKSIKTAFGNIGKV